MPDWTPLRQRAYALHLRMRAHIPKTTALLLSAERLLAAAEQETGLARTPVGADDSLLAGAHAVLDRQLEAVWYSDAASPERQRFAQAHEFAHYWLHPELVSDACVVSEAEEDYLPPSDRAQALLIAEGYSPDERRETEANLFAAEFLLPGPNVRRLFLREGWNASRIASRSGLSEACVLSQLMQGVLLPVPTTEGEPRPARIRTGAQTAVSGQEARDCGIEELPRVLSLGLDPSQQMAATVARGPALVDAGPGTGKTRTLIARILHLLQDRECAPEQLLALTFSNKAAEEMRTRLRERVGETADRVWIGTFHAFGMEILRKYGGFSTPPRLVETVDAIALLERNLDRLHLSEYEYLSQPSLPFPDILRCISRAKDELHTPEDYMAMAKAQAQAARDEREYTAAAKSLEIARIYAVYQELLAERSALDFGDLLMRTVFLLDAVTPLRERLQSQYRQILADEYQDINRASAQLLRRLAGNGEGFWAVGDLRQAIYRFRGASPANVREFERDFPGGRRLRLDRNYRSRPGLVSLFSAFAGAMGAQTPSEERDKEFFAWQASRESPGGHSLTVAVASDETAQAAGLTAQIRHWESAGIPLRDQAILCRSNAQCSDLAERLEAQGIPTQHLGGLFERGEIKDLLALLALATDSEGTTLIRVAGFPEYGVPEEDARGLLLAAQEAKQAFPGALELAADLPALSEAGRRGLLRLRSHLKSIAFRKDAWRMLTRYLFETSGYLRMLLAEETVAARQKSLAIYQLLTFAQGVGQKLAEEGVTADSRAFLDYLRRLRLYGEERSIRLPGSAEALDGARLMTVHASKGLEFPVVYLPNLIKDQFPPRRMGGMAAPPPGLTEGEATDSGEECLFFVALSRARDHLVLSRPLTWRNKPAAPSYLLENLEEALTQCGAARVEWESPLSPEPMNDAIPEVAPFSRQERPMLSLSALQQYQSCPRQYYYQRVARLPYREERSAYLRFTNCLQEALNWLQSEREAGNPTALEAVYERLSARWAEVFTVEEGGAVQVLRQYAEALLAGAHRSGKDRAVAANPLELTAELPNGRILLRCDQAEELPDGTLRLTRQIRGRARADDHTDPRLALLRHAARQQAPNRPVQIVLDYLRDGEAREVPESKRYEPPRIEKYDKALFALRNGDFAPLPEDRKCATCPYLFVCPT